MRKNRADIHSILILHETGKKVSFNVMAGNIHITDALWNKIEPLIPKHKTKHPLECHRPRVPDRDAMNAIFFVLKTGCHLKGENERF